MGLYSREKQQKEWKVITSTVILLNLTVYPEKHLTKDGLCATLRGPIQQTIVVLF